MSPAERSRGRMDAALARLERWVRERLAEAGYHEVQVVDDRAADSAQGPRLVIWPYRLVPWPRRVEQAQELAMLRTTERQAGVPEPWREVARLMTEALTSFGEVGPRGLVLPLVDSLPAPLAAWYRAAGRDWILTGQDFVRARPPALMWRSSHTLRAQLLLLAEIPPGRPERGLSLLAALIEAANADRSLDLELPGPTPEPELLSLLGALESLLPAAQASALASAVEAVTRPARWSVPLVPYPDLEHEDLGFLCRSIGRPLRAAVTLAIQVPMGGGPSLQPATGSATTTSQPLR